MHAKHLGFLDGIRGYAALYVLTLHCMIWGGWYVLPLPDPKLAVDVFMVLSGYLMVYQWNSRDPDWQLQRAVVGNFAIRRFFRIAPVYYVLLGLAFLFAAALHHGDAAIQTTYPAIWPPGNSYDPARIHSDVYNFLAHLTFLFGFIPRYGHSTFMGDWSIGIEMQFYAALPFLLLALRRFGYVRVSVGVLLLAVLSNHYVAPHFEEPSLLFFKLPIFLAGMLAAESSRMFTKDTTGGIAVFVIAIVLAATTRSVTIVSVVAVEFSLVSLCGSRILTAPVRALNSFLSNRIASFLADTSYPVYLLHTLVLTLLGGHLFTWSWFLLHGARFRTGLLFMTVLTVSYPLAWMLHLAIEIPGIRLGKALLAKRLKGRHDRELVAS